MFHSRVEINKNSPSNQEELWVQYLKQTKVKNVQSFINLVAIIVSYNFSKWSRCSKSFLFWNCFQNGLKYSLLQTINPMSSFNSKQFLMLFSLIFSIDLPNFMMRGNVMDVTDYNLWDDWSDNDLFSKVVLISLSCFVLQNVCIAWQVK